MDSRNWLSISFAENWCQASARRVEAFREHLASLSQGRLDLETDLLHRTMRFAQLAPNEYDDPRNRINFRNAAKLIFSNDDF
jgi:hypothetical protein